MAGTQGPGGPHGPFGQDGPFEPFEPFEPPTGHGSSGPYAGPHDRSAAYVPEHRTNGYNHDRRPAGSRRVGAARLWAGGLVVALMTALAAAVAVLLARGVLGIPVFAPVQDATVLGATGRVALGAALAALLATAVLQLALRVTTRPARFLTWIVALATSVAMLLPFTSYASWQAKAGTAGICLVTGAVIGTLLAAVARGAARR